MPDIHFFNNRGGKDIHPLYRSPNEQDPNVSKSLLEGLEKIYGAPVQPFEVAAYVVGLLGTSAYTKQFEEELTESTAHVIFPTNPELFSRVAELGRQIIYEQTWGERGAELNEFGQPTGSRFRGRAFLASPTNAGEYPESWSYTEEAEQLTVGSGRFGDVSPEVMNYEVSGMNIVASWLGYRMKTPAGKTSSPLDQIQADGWQHDTELLELLWQLEFMIKAEKEGSALLQEVLAGHKISPSELGLPTAAERKAPTKKKGDTIF